MTQTQIETLFWETIQEKAAYNKLVGVTEDQIYTWKNRPGKAPNFGIMLQLLFTNGKIKVTNGSTSKSPK